MQNEDSASNGNLAQNAVLSDSQHSAELLKRIEKGFTVPPMPIAQNGERLLKTNCVCFFVLSSLSSLSAKVTFAELYRDKNNNHYFSAKGATPKKR